MKEKTTNEIVNNAIKLMKYKTIKGNYKEFNEALMKKVLYNSEVKQEKEKVVITLRGENDEQN